MSKHKWAKEIHAWADGAEIEFYHSSYARWVEAPSNPDWSGSIKYRIKPQPVVASGQPFRFKDEALLMIEKAELTGNLNDLVLACDACKEALEQPAQEPVGVVSWHEGTVMGSIFPSSNMPKDGDKLYTHPKEWRGLTDEERNKIWSNIEAEENTEMYFGGKLALAIEAKLKEKNT